MSRLHHIFFMVLLKLLTVSVIIYVYCGILGEYGIAAEVEIFFKQGWAEEYFNCLVQAIETGRIE